jgi:site-specific DNA-methyltransferase (adenine-specific)
MNAIHYSSNKDEWETPPEIFNPLDAEFDFDVDVCADENNNKCQLFFCKISETQNGLTADWAASGHKVFWCNPPYSNLKAWIAKNAAEAKKGMTCVMLIPSRTDTKAWHTYIYDSKLWRFRPGIEARFLPGRVKFVGGKHCAPFPSCIVIFRPL